MVRGQSHTIRMIPTITAPHPEGRGLAQAITQALYTGGVAPSDVDCAGDEQAKAWQQAWERVSQPAALSGIDDIRARARELLDEADGR